MEITEILMNSVRQRILQCFLVNDKVTVKEIKKFLPDISSASLYRHIKLLSDNSVITVVGENRIRGTVESIYSLNKGALEIDDTNDANCAVVQSALLGICASFAKYFASGNAAPKKDMLMLSMCTLTLTDDEFKDFLTEINEIALKYMNVKVCKGSKTRRVTLISSPDNEQAI